MTDDIIQGTFSVGVLDDGRFVAASRSAPYFLVRADTHEGALTKVRRVLKSYRDYRLGDPGVIEREPPRPISVTAIVADRRFSFAEVMEAA